MEVWYLASDRKLEQDWEELLKKSNRFRTPIPRFGSSVYRRSRSQHLFYCERRPTFAWFEEVVARAYEPALAIERVMLS